MGNSESNKDHDMLELIDIITKIVESEVDYLEEYLINSLNTEDIKKIKKELNIINISGESLGLEFLEAAKYSFISILIIRLNILLELNNPNKYYDVFLSHTSRDAIEVLGVKLKLFAKGKISYIDWLDHMYLDYPRSLGLLYNVLAKYLKVNLLEIDSKITAKFKRKSKKEIVDEVLRQIRRIDNTIYIQSYNYSQSKWMAYEIGIAEALLKRVYRLPIYYNRRRKDYADDCAFLVKLESIVNKSDIDVLKLK